jgi:hypothetical protein
MKIHNKEKSVSPSAKKKSFSRNKSNSQRKGSVFA